MHIDILDFQEFDYFEAQPLLLQHLFWQTAEKLQIEDFLARFPFLVRFQFPF